MSHVFNINFEDMPDYSLQHRLHNHIQGCVHTGDGLVLARNGVEKGQLIFTRENRFVDARLVPQQHVGGMDSNHPYLIAPTYNHNEAGGYLHIYNLNDLSALTKSHQCPHRCYAAGMTMIGEVGRYLVAVVTRANGSRIQWYQWHSKRGKDGLMDPVGTSHFSPREGPRNNIFLKNSKRDGCKLFTFRAHFGHGVVTRYNVDTKHNMALTREATYTRRNGLCSARFGATLLIDGRWLRTARNVFSDRLRYRIDEISWKDCT